MTLPMWDDGADGDAWSVVWLGGELLPGLAEVTTAPSRDIDVQKSSGSDGARLKDTGYQPAEVTIALRMSSQEQLQAWEALLPSLHPRRPGGLRQPLAIQHPNPNSFGVVNVYPKKISAPPPVDGVWTVTIECLEWFPGPKKAPKASAPKTGETTTDPATASPATIASPDYQGPPFNVGHAISMLTGPLKSQGIL